MSNFNDMSDDAKNKAKKLYKEGIDTAESVAHQITEGAANLYEEGKRKVNDLDDCICEYTDELINKVKEKPLTSLLIAGGIGYLLSHLFKKK